MAHLLALVRGRTIPGDGPGKNRKNSLYQASVVGTEAIVKKYTICDSAAPAATLLIESEMMRSKASHFGCGLLVIGCKLNTKNAI